jgi:hypothetical protein
MTEIVKGTITARQLTFQLSLGSLAKTDSNFKNQTLGYYYFGAEFSN